MTYDLLCGCKLGGYPGEERMCEIHEGLFQSRLCAERERAAGLAEAHARATTSPAERETSLVLATRIRDGRG